MILLDTNIISELMRPLPEPVVECWLAQQRPDSVFTTSVTEAELRFGVALLPDGRRRASMAAGIEGLLRAEFAGRILPFDSAAAGAFAEIAAIARTRAATLATRNVADFLDCGVEVFNPWGLRA